MTLASAITMSPFLFFAGISWSTLPSKFWMYFCISGIGNTLAFTGLFLAYMHSDISLAYPLTRALPVLLTPFFTMAFGIGKTPSPMALLGMLIVFCGCLLMPLANWSDFKLKNYISPVMGAILLVAFGITGYTIFDSLATPILVEHATGGKIAACAVYLLMIEIIIIIGLLPNLIRKEERVAIRSLCCHSWAPYLSGAFTPAAYILVLLAMPMVTNVSYVQAFRQMGLPLSVVAGVLLLKEKCSLPRLAGIVAIVIGLVLIALN